MQLQMLVSDEDEYIYKAIKLNLEALRECVIGGLKSVKNENSVLSCSIQFLGSLCRGANSKYQRRLLRNMNAHVLVLEMLQMLSLSYSENSNVVECIRHAHQFLRRFCHCDPRNQELLFGQIDILFCHMDPRIEEIKTLISIFLDNMDLCNKVGGQLIQKVVQATAKDRNVDYLQFLCNIVKMGSTYIKKNQDIVMQEILVSGDVLVFYNDTRSIQHLVNLIEENNGSEGPITNALDYHLQLIRLLLVCTAGKNAVTQIKCQSLISIESIITILSLETALVEVKEEYLRLAQFCYIDTDLDFKSQELVKTILDPLWSLVRFCTQEISKFVDVPDIPSQTRLFLCETVVSFIKKFFSSLYIETGHIFMLHTYHDLFTQLVGNLLLINRASWMSPFYHNSIRMLLQLMFDIAQNKHISLSDELKEFLTSEPSSPQLETRFTQNSMEEASQCRSVMPFNRSRHEVSSQFIELSLQELVIQLEQFYHSVIGAESAVLATIFSFPELLKMTDWMSFVEIGKDPSFTEHIIRCTNSLWERREDELVVKLLATLKRSLEPTPQLNERGICARNELMYSCVTGIGSHKELLQLFNENANVFNLVIDRIDTKFDLLAKQNRFTALEAPSLMVSLVMLSTNHTVLIEAINLGIALLQGGNCNVQKAFLYIFTQPCAEVFFAVLHEKFRRAQNELKNSYFTISNDSPPQYSSPCIPSCGVRLSKYSCQEGTDTMGSEEGTLAYSLAMKILSSDEIVIIQPLCRFLQLLCENHNTKLQHYLMFQPDHNISYNLVLDTLQLLDCMCGGTAGDLRQPGLYINLKNMGIVQQCLVSLTEYCQGPCKLAQDCIVLYESIGIDVIVSLVANEISPLCEDRLDLVLQLKNSATKALLSIMESREDSRIADQILLKMDAPVHLLDICKNAFLDEKENAFDGDVTLGLGHNLYILLYQLSSHSEELTQAFQDNRTHPALRFYAEHTEVIEIARADKSLERIVFPVPGICSNLTCATQQRVFNCTEKDQSGSRNIDFFSQLDDLYVEMDTQRDLKETHWQYWLSSHGVTWVALEFSINIIINLLVALFYPFLAADNRISTFSYIYILLIWVLSISVLLSARLIGRMNYSLKVFLTAVSFVGMTVLALYPYFGLGVLCKLLGLVLLINRGVCLNCYLALKGALTSDSAFWTERQFLYDFDFLYHGCYTLIAVLGLTVHPFFYPFLLFDVVYREETLKDIVKSVTKSSTSLLLIVLLGYIIIYLFSIVGYLFFQGDFVTETVVIHENNTATNKVEYACTSLIMCILTTLKNGFRNDGGIGDSMRTPSIEDPNYMFRIFYDMAFFFCVVILILNLILGVIIETFVNLRTEKKDRKNFLENNCFICGLDRSQFDRKKVTFQEHITKEHNPWHYLHFIILLKEKVYTEFTGPESFVALSIEKNNMCWIPISCCMSLNREESEEKFYDMADIQKLLNNTVMKLNWRSTEDMSAGHT